MASASKIKATKAELLQSLQEAEEQISYLEARLAVSEDLEERLSNLRIRYDDLALRFDKQRKAGQELTRALKQSEARNQQLGRQLETTQAELREHIANQLSDMFKSIET
ncbi:hypothetical protein HXX25_00140 [Hyphobacterium sp. CCMP332]|uniref:hypothetical protein n=1 Tax=Hyphobacterium sp. CCMP332 TaxID=2749086 RepID=UPI0016501591|nr:hypothetical protein [Hyphobacterium sp. CCMP332]QNL17878.1 hypothetical protein HXX25_00140 [Hyphobacterium sp. CCMP332]